MSVKKSLLWAALSCCFAPAGAGAAVFTFEDLTPPAATGYDAMPNSYAGLTFSGWYYGYDNTYTPASGVIDLFTDYADPTNPADYVVTKNNSITSATPFYFGGAWFSGYSGVTFELSLGGTLVATSATLPDAGALPYAPTFLDSGYAGLVDSVVVSGVQGYYSMDDLSVTFQSAQGVPEPSSLLLAVGALAAVGATRRKQS
ncbi:PEP-CTERM sorting domain-containing protein [Ideonella sp. DXS22W]|uniref:PEP-CTERM sorting domain-containing protein n=1 Tax=Pseudaquabacterium inlustre TaxID=2984192 RepID=A0ABU9CGN1_9BURK